MPKPILFAVPMALGIIGAAYTVQRVLPIKTASAEQNMSYYVPETKWEVDTTPLNVLLDNGWFIHTTAGMEGQVITLFKDKKFMRCNLSGPKDSNIRVDMEEKTFSVCHKLN